MGIVDQLAVRFSHTDKLSNTGDLMQRQKQRTLPCRPAGRQPMNGNFRRESASRSLYQTCRGATIFNF